MTNSNVTEYELMQAGIDEVVADLTERADRIHKDPESLLYQLNPELTTSDKRGVGDVGIRAQLIETYREALCNGPYGWVDDVLAFRRPWGFDLKKFSCRFCFGTVKTTFSPPSATLVIWRRRSRARKSRWNPARLISMRCRYCPGCWPG